MIFIGPNLSEVIIIKGLTFFKSIFEGGLFWPHKNLYIQKLCQKDVEHQILLTAKNAETQSVDCTKYCLPFSILRPKNGNPQH